MIGAIDNTFNAFFLRNSYPNTGPNMRVAKGSPFLFNNIIALSSKLTFIPPENLSFFVLITIALCTEPLFTVLPAFDPFFFPAPDASPFFVFAALDVRALTDFTLITIISPTEAVLRFECPNIFMHAASLAPELSETTTLVPTLIISVYFLTLYHPRFHCGLHQSEIRAPFKHTVFTLCLLYILEPLATTKS